MDYRGFRAGVTVYFPVFVEGALFHLGDGHALQGDGEIVGTGIEVSTDVEFTVEVVKGKEIFWPRADDGEFVMAVGNARPLDQAVQHATTELMRLLAEDHGLDYRASSALLGQCIRYDVGNVFDPAYTMVAKVAEGSAAVSRADPSRRAALDVRVPEGVARRRAPTSALPVEADVDAIAPAFRDPAVGGEAGLPPWDAEMLRMVLREQLPADDRARPAVAVRHRRHAVRASRSAA